ncbi:IclR family transcriptional regulator [Clostridium culturomicium]|uniref:IclR family transcriptional regulator n=1 Tax=Clostridium culturomicium TaxID=1499683 RepID=UPI00058EA298|nr:IclR family transcriptional regulator [Clostridium culturomicium]
MLERALNTLTVLSENKNGLSISELSAKLNIPPSSIHRIVSVLKKNNFVIQDPVTKKYKIAYKVLSLAQNLTFEDSLIDSARPHMDKLASDIDKTICLCIMEEDKNICIDYVENKDTALFKVNKGIAMPLHATSAGKVFHAYMDKYIVMEQMNSIAMNPITPYTKTDLNTYLKELEEIRVSGYSICDEELQLGIQGLACPIFDMNNKVVAAISFTAIKSENFICDKSINLVKETAKAISKDLGSR